MFKHGHGHGRGMGHGHGAAAATPADPNAPRSQSKGYWLVAIVYLLGLAIGALDMSIVNPARTVIQNTLGVEDSLGIWIMTIYTLAYAAAIPVVGKLADRHGRKWVYLGCIFLFGLGSFLCGFAQTMSSFEMLLAARVIQALGAGGIMPVATAEFGTAFPEEKRGMALGIVGMVYGLSSILGPSVGSLILEIVGQQNWQFVFYVNIPVCAAVLLLGFKRVPNTKEEKVLPIDGLGIAILTVMTLSLMYGLRNIDFFDFAQSIQSTEVWPFLLLFVALMFPFILRERVAKDPVINLSYFKSANVVIAMLCAIVSGVIMMGTLFYPQFCENALFMKSGSGGYFFMLLGVGSAIGSMGSGGLLDKHGVKPVLGFGFLAAAAGSLFMALVACNYPNLLTVCLTLLLTGLGLGFTMGAPLNYMMLQDTPEEESNSALATLSLVRSVGTAVAPAIMVAFIVHAGGLMQDRLMDVMPKEVSVSPLPYAQELDDQMDELRSDDEFKKMLKGLDIPKLTDYQTVEVNIDDADSDKDVTISPETEQALQDSDVTTIPEACKTLTRDVFGQLKPDLIKDATDGINDGLKTMRKKLGEMDDALGEMDDGAKDLDSSISKMSSNMSTLQGKKSKAQKSSRQMKTAIAKQNKAIKKMDKAIKQQKTAISKLKAAAAKQKTAIDKMAAGLKQMEGSLAGMKKQMGPNAPAVKQMQKKVDDMKSSLKKLKTARSKILTSKSKLQTALNKVKAGRTKLVKARNKLKAALSWAMPVRRCRPPS
ncbi:MAG: MFS transporter [Coriobacteriia bacterium]|nr:MFS transporter [Coriobacteriia bacterium]